MGKNPTLLSALCDDGIFWQLRIVLAVLMHHHQVE